MYFNKTKIKSNNNHVNNNKADYPLFILVSLLIIISIVFSYSLTIYTVEFFGYDEFHFFIRQAGVGIVAILIMWRFSLIDPDKIVEKVGMTLFIAFFLLMILMPFLPASMVTASGELIDGLGYLVFHYRLLSFSKLDLYISYLGLFIEKFYQNLRKLA